LKLLEAAVEACRRVSLVGCIDRVEKSGPIYRKDKTNWVNEMIEGSTEDSCLRIRSACCEDFEYDSDWGDALLALNNTAENVELPGGSEGELGITFA